jgi:hypothetical protein
MRTSSQIYTGIAVVTYLITVGAISSVTAFAPPISTLLQATNKMRYSTMHDTPKIIILASLLAKQEINIEDTNDDSDNNANVVSILRNKFDSDSSSSSSSATTNSDIENNNKDNKNGIR